MTDWESVARQVGYVPDRSYAVNAAAIKAEQRKRRKLAEQRRLKTMRERYGAESIGSLNIKMHHTPWYLDEHGNRCRQIWAV